MADEEREYQPTLAERIADAIPVELTATPHVGVGGARRLKIAYAVMPVVQAEADKVRAEVAEGIAQAIEAHGGISCPECKARPDSINPLSGQAWCANGHMWFRPLMVSHFIAAAAIARGYAAPDGTGTGAT